MRGFYRAGGWGGKSKVYHYPIGVVKTVFQIAVIFVFPYPPIQFLPSY